MKRLAQHVKKYIICGLLAIIPLALTFVAVQLLYNMIDQRVVKILDQVIGFSFPGLGLILVLASLYILGVIASNIVGRQAFHLI